MTPNEVVLWIEGFDYRQDLMGQMWAHFAAIGINAQRTKKDKKVEARKLWGRRTEPAKQDPDAADLEARKKRFQQLRQTIGSIPVRHHPKGRAGPVPPPS